MRRHLYKTLLRDVHFEPHVLVRFGTFVMEMYGTNRWIGRIGRGEKAVAFGSPRFANAPNIIVIVGDCIHHAQDFFLVVVLLLLFESVSNLDESLIPVSPFGAVSHGDFADLREILQRQGMSGQVRGIPLEVMIVGETAPQSIAGTRYQNGVQSIPTIVKRNSTRYGNLGIPMHVLPGFARVIGWTHARNIGTALSQKVDQRD